MTIDSQSGLTPSRLPGRSPVRRSSQVGSARGMVLVVGLWLVTGVYALLDGALRLAGNQVAWAYLVVGLLFLPTILSWAELMGWVRGTGGSYRLVRATERRSLIFFVSMMHLLGWVSLKALLAFEFARYASALLGLVLPSPDSRLLGVALVLFFALANLFGYRSRRRLQIYFMGLAALLLVVLSVWLVAGDVAALTRPPVGQGPNYFAVIAILSAAMWAIDTTFEMQSVHRHPLRVLLAGTLVGPVVGFALAFVAARVVAPGVLNGTTLALAGYLSDVMGVAGHPVTLGIGVLAIGAAWEIVSLASLRQISAIGTDGWLPEWLIRPHRRYRTPARMIILQALAVLVLIWLPRMTSLRLAELAALAGLCVAIGLNIAAFALSQHAQAEQRPIRLPGGRIIPAVGFAISVLLLFALPSQVLLVGLVWLAASFAIFWRFGGEGFQEAQQGITIFQETEAFEKASDFTVLVAVGEPERDAHLVAYGEAVARQHGGRAVALHVVLVPDQLQLDSRRGYARDRLEVLERATDNLESAPGSVQAITRLSRTAAQGILDTAADEAADLIVLGWNARPTGSGGLGHTIDHVIANALTDVSILHGKWQTQPRRILVPTRGGGNALLAARQALSLTAAGDGSVELFIVVRSPANQEALDEAQHILTHQLELLDAGQRVIGRVVESQNPVQAIVDVAPDFDAVMLGATEESILDQALFGRVPQQIASQSGTPVAIVRRHKGLPVFWLQKAWTSLSDALPTLDRDEQITVYQRLRRGARAGTNYFVLIVLSAIIATLGLLLNSPAVIIGAMLVAPLMTPIMALGMGISFGDARTLRLSVASTLQGVLVAIFIAIAVTSLSPIKGLNTEILSRTQPTLLDLFVALVSGLAGAYAIARKEVSDALPGVAVAAALMPPVCTVGIGFAQADLEVAFGALLLFVTNLIAITMAGALVFLLVGIRPPRERARQEALRRGLTTTAISLVLVSLPLGLFLFRASAHDQLTSRVRQTLEAETVAWNTTEIESLAVDSRRSGVFVETTVRTGYEVTQADVMALDESLEEALNRPVRIQLSVIPLAEWDSGGEP